MCSGPRKKTLCDWCEVEPAENVEEAEARRPDHPGALWMIVFRSENGLIDFVFLKDHHSGSSEAIRMSGIKSECTDPAQQPRS